MGLLGAEELAVQSFRVLVHIGNIGFPVLGEGERGLLFLNRNGLGRDKAVRNAVVIGAELHLKALGLQGELVVMVPNLGTLENGGVIQGIHALLRSFGELGAGAPESTVLEGEADGRGRKQGDSVPLNAVS